MESPVHHDDVVFCDPPRPVPRHTADRTEAIRAALSGLRDRQGEWARITGPHPKGTASVIVMRVKRGKYGGEPGEFDATQRKVDDGVYVWARYEGTPEGAA